MFWGFAYYYHHDSHCWGEGGGLLEEEAICNILCSELAAICLSLVLIGSPDPWEDLKIRRPIITPIKSLYALYNFPYGSRGLGRHFQLDATALSALCSLQVDSTLLVYLFKGVPQIDLKIMPGII